MQIRIYEHRHYLVKSDIQMENIEERTGILKWIAHVISTDGAEASWFKNPKKPIFKASLFFAAEFWWAATRA